MVLDCGGGEDPIADDLLRCLTVLSPNETELARLSGTLTAKPVSVVPVITASIQLFAVCHYEH